MAKLFVVVAAVRIVAFFGYFCWFSVVVAVAVVAGNYSMSFALALLWLLATSIGGQVAKEQKVELIVWLACALTRSMAWTMAKMYGQQ